MKIKKWVVRSLLVSILIMGLISCAKTEDNGTTDPTSDIKKNQDAVEPGIPQDEGSVVGNVDLLFKWTPAVNPDDPVVGYNLQVGTEPGGYDVFNEYVGNVTEYIVTGSVGDTLYARVQAVYASAKSSDWTESSNGIKIVSNPGLELAWIFQTQGKVKAKPVISGKLIILVSQDDTVYALNRTTGKEIWRFTTGNTLKYDVNGVHGENYYIQELGGDFYALSVATGEIVWQTKLDIEPIYEPVFRDGKIYIATAWGGPGVTPDQTKFAKLIVLNETDGSLEWQYETALWRLSRVVITDDKIFLAGLTEDIGDVVQEGGLLRILKLDKAACEADGAGNCTIDWTYISDNGHLKSLYLYDGVLSYMGYRDYAVGIDSSSGEEVWNFYTQNWSNGFSTYENMIYIGSDDQSVYALDVSTGLTRWECPVGREFFDYSTGLPEVTEERIYVYTVLGSEIIAIDRSQGTEIWSFTTDVWDAMYGPLVYDGKLYLVSWDFNLYTYDILW